MRMFPALAGLGLIGGILGILAFIFWLWMLIDILQKKRFKDKLIWVIVLLLTNFLGAILYYFLVKSKEK